MTSAKIWIILLGLNGVGWLGAINAASLPGIFVPMQTDVLSADHLKTTTALLDPCGDFYGDCWKQWRATKGITLSVDTPPDLPRPSLKIIHLTSKLDEVWLPISRLTNEVTATSCYKQAGHVEAELGIRSRHEWRSLGPLKVLASTTPNWSFSKISAGHLRTDLPANVVVRVEGKGIMWMTYIILKGLNK